MSEPTLRDVQVAVGTVLIPEARAAQKALPTMDESLPIALELFYSAMALKRAYRDGGAYVARAYAGRMGLDPDQVEAFAHHRLSQVLTEEPL